MVKVQHGDHEDDLPFADANTLVSYAAVAFLHQELQKVSSITVAKESLDALDKAVDGDTVAALGIQFNVGENGSIVLTEVKRKDDA